MLCVVLDNVWLVVMNRLFIVIVGELLRILVFICEIELVIWLLMVVGNVMVVVFCGMIVEWKGLVVGYIS